MLEEAKRGTISVPCADGHHFHDLFRQHRELCDGHDNHPLALNGGALLLPERSPLRRRADGSYKPDDEVLLDHIEGAVKLEKGKTIILYAHAPCGMARLHELSIQDEFVLLTEAKRRVRERVASLGVTDVRLWFHVYYSNQERRTYHFHRPAWENYLKENSRLSA